MATFAVGDIFKRGKRDMASGIERFPRRFRGTESVHGLT
jgi:hypothetical protein